MSSKNAQASCVSGSTVMSSEENVLPYGPWACAAASTSGRAACTAQWMATAAPLTARSPSTTSPSWLTRTRSDDLIIEKCMPNGLTQYVVGSPGSRTVMCPATPSSRPALENIRNAAAIFALRCARSSSTVSNVCGSGMYSCLPTVMVDCTVDWSTAPVTSSLACSTAGLSVTLTARPPRRTSGSSVYDAAGSGRGDRLEHVQ